MSDCNAQSLGIAYVPVQKADFTNIYSEKEALHSGTIFPELNLPFFITETDKMEAGASCTGPLKDIMETGFFLDDLTLYLDTHPDDKEALSLMNEYLKKKEQLVTEFSKSHFTLTKNCVPQAEESNKTFAWADGPAPWEGVCE
ncbi:CotJB protein [uncultured Roseburia sp.]|uniref:Spore coat protein CotJB n=1 Tax=Brotonthovivens ammoniilytica TaxID=2981725 RepID=A0ABT2TKQ5_9FIRM|nr:spore coat protein CotJB [Brotonthovivens ammoniilytica]MCU6762799.1 spore coat protein CotJB [Brotonthovivens ammoniilytica]SCI89339.1 CotJB protein [uncultured Roseburia sp.]